MRSSLLHAVLAATVLCLTAFSLNLSASARDVVLPAGTLLQCTLNEPNFSSATVDVGDPVLCHLRAQTEFGKQAFPRGAYLVGHLEAAKDPGHFWGKGYMKLQFDRIGLPNGDLPLTAKVIATRGYKVDKEGKIDGKGHAKRDVVEWMLPPLWPWKVLMLPARGPRPKLTGETQLSLRLMDDVDIPQLAQTFGPGWHFFGHSQDISLRDARRNDQPANDAGPQLTLANVSDAASAGVVRASYATYVTKDVALAANASSGSSLPVFVLNNGSALVVSGYGYQNNRITYTLAAGGTGVISTDDVDWPTTTRVNARRGVRVTLHAGHISAETSGM